MNNFLEKIINFKTLSRHSSTWVKCRMSLKDIVSAITTKASDHIITT